MPTDARLAKIDRVAMARQHGAVVLEDIHDPHNAAAVTRTCDAVGFQKLDLSFVREPPFDPRAFGTPEGLTTTRKISKGAHKWLDYRLYSSTEACLETLRAEGHTLIATALTDRAVPLHEADLGMLKPALMLGNEHHGLSAAAVAMADLVVTLPMDGMAQSLNLSVTAAVCLYEIKRQRHAAGIERYLLPEERRLALKDDFLAR